MCKMYAYHIPCQFEEKFKTCRQIHSKVIRAAHDHMIARTEKDEPISRANIIKILDPDQKLTDDEKIGMI